MDHAMWCQQKAFAHSDAAKRIADEYNLHRIAIGIDAVGKWIACSLADGRSDHTLYDSRRDAVAHMHHNEHLFTFIKINPSSMNACEAEVMLKTARTLYDKGLRLSDPDDAHGGRDVIKRVSVEDQLAQSRGRNINLILPERN